MCNFYSVTKGQSAIRNLFSVKHDRAGNLPSLSAIFLDQMAPVVRVGADGERELVMARWGMPGPPQHGGQPVRNIRNVKNPHWRGWLGKGNRCVVPATSFCQYLDTKPRKTPIWFALSEDRPLFAFAGLWTPWRGVRGPKSAPVEGDHELFGFLTTEANAIVAPVHPKAMPVILTTPAEVEQWLEADTPEALLLQRPLPDEALRIVAKGERSDNPSASIVDKSREIVMPKQTDSSGFRPARDIKAEEREPIAPVEAVRESDTDRSLNRLEQPLTSGTPPAPSVHRSRVAPAADTGGAAYDWEKDSSRLEVMTQGPSWGRALIASALFLAGAAAIALAFVVNGGTGLQKGLDAAADRQTVVQLSRDDAVPEPGGAAAPPVKDGADSARVEVLHAEPPPGPTETASTGSAAPPTGGPAAIDPARSTATMAGPGLLKGSDVAADRQTVVQLSTGGAVPEPDGVGSPRVKDDADLARVEVLQSVERPVEPTATASSPPPAGGPAAVDPAHPTATLAGPAAEASTVSIFEAPGAEPPSPRAAILASVSSAAESEESLLGGMAPQGPAKPGRTATSETAGSEEPSNPQATPPATHNGALSGGAAVAKIDAISPPVSNRPPARAHPKRERAAKAHITAQAPAEPPPPLPVEPPPPEPAEASQPPPAEPAAEPGNPLLRALGDALNEAGGLQANKR